ncbi:MAG: (Na+)-NQR maturation NqrM [Leptospiraceae bacterium]|nr:(Na+)-NQR maturation NqrM [Leptospiraceae bacterium]MCB1321398.1 (Na+)-NQR maturation NqrM [Leptospiraceae bacterium]
METVLFTLALLAACFVFIGIGALFGRKPIRGSCGGLASGNADGECSICGGDPSRCEESSPTKENNHYSTLMNRF